MPRVYSVSLAPNGCPLLARVVVVACILQAASAFGNGAKLKYGTSHCATGASIARDREVQMPAHKLLSRYARYQGGPLSAAMSSTSVLNLVPYTGLTFLSASRFRTRKAAFMVHLASGRSGPAADLERSAPIH